MSKARLCKVETILSKLRAKNAPTLSNIFIWTDGADLERQLAAWREKGGKGNVLILPDNGRDPEGVKAQRRELLAGTSYAEPDTVETPPRAAPAGSAASDPAPV